MTLLYVIRAALFNIFLQPLPYSAPPPTELLISSISVSPPASSTLGSDPLSPTVMLSVADRNNGRNVANASLALSFQPAGGSSSDWTVRWGLEHTILDYVGAAAGGRFAVPGFVPRSLRYPAAVGGAVKTGSGGTAQFFNLAAPVGVPGTYDILATSLTPVASSAIVSSAILTTAVQSVTAISAQVFNSSLSVRVGDALPTFQVQIKNSNGVGLAGKRAVLLSAPLDAAEFSNLATNPSLFHPRLAFFDNAVSALSDASGIATFSNVRLRASSVERVAITVSVDGVLLPSQLVLSCIDEVTLEVVTPPSIRVVEGLPLDVQPVIRVTKNVNGLAVPAKGYVVMAFPGIRAGFWSASQASPQIVAELGGLISGSNEAIVDTLGRAKHTFNILSMPSDDDGLAKFVGLGFTRHGPAGAYSLIFAAQGVARDTPNLPITVVSSVANVAWWTASKSDTDNYAIDFPDALLTGPIRAARKAAVAVALASSGINVQMSAIASTAVVNTTKLSADFNALAAAAVAAAAAAGPPKYFEWYSDLMDKRRQELANALGSASTPAFLTEELKSLSSPAPRTLSEIDSSSIQINARSPQRRVLTGDSAGAFGPGGFSATHLSLPISSLSSAPQAQYLRDLFADSPDDMAALVTAPRSLRALASSTDCAAPSASSCASASSPASLPRL